LSLKPPAPGPVDGEVQGAVERVGERLRSLGHEVEERDPAYGTAFSDAVVRYLAGIAEDAERFPRPERLQRRTRGFVRLGRLIPSPVVDRARRREAAHAARINELFRDHDVLLTPTTARPPVVAAAWEGTSALHTLLGEARAYPFTGMWNMTGQPALSIPAPPADGLPIGAQLIGPPDGEARLLALAAQLERELGWPDQRPPLVR
jgi:amidase